MAASFCTLIRIINLYMGNSASFENSKLVAACGLYCGACRKYQKAKCPGCLENHKAEWCKIRACCREHAYRSCADCPGDTYTGCKKFNNLIGKIFALLFRSDRPACIARIKTVGYEAYSKEMHETNRQTIKK